MKTLSVLYAIDTKKQFNWSDFTTPLMVSDDQGALYVIVSSLYTDEMEILDGDVPDGVELTTYYIVNLTVGELNPVGFISIADLAKAYFDAGINLTPVKGEILVKDYLEIK